MNLGARVAFKKKELDNYPLIFIAKTRPRGRIHLGCGGDLLPAWL
jgi:hypothetical protein